MISFIYARSLDHCIGDKGRVPWHLPDEFAHFEQTTIGKPIIMGRKTYEDHQSALPGRLHIVLSSRQGYQVPEGVELVHSLQSAIDVASLNSEDIFVIGGVAVFAAFFAKSNIVYETVVEAEIGGDTVLPEFDFTGWNHQLLFEHPIDERHNYAFNVHRYSRAAAPPG